MKTRFLPLLFALLTLTAGALAQNYSARSVPAPVQPQTKYKIWTNPEIQPPATTEPREAPLVPESPLKPALVEESRMAVQQPVQEEKAQKAVEEIVASELEKNGEKPEEPEKEPEKKNVWDLASWVSPEGIQGSAVTVLILSAVSLAPAFLMMTTSFVRIFVVLGILRHGFGTQGIPGTQVLAALALFMTFFIMYPTWEKTWNDALAPYQAGELTSKEALEKGLQPMRKFMATQLERAGNAEEILLFWRYSSTPPDESRLAEYTAEDVPLHVLLPAFMLGELKTAFLIGVQLLIPMLVVDLLVSSILVSMGMIMLPPTMVSLPFKLLLFVLADGWRLVVEMLIGSF